MILNTNRIVSLKLFLTKICYTVIRDVLVNKSIITYISLDNIE
jgi:hypothetical protein